jgi:hydroxymethylbilane synthase
MRSPLIIATRGSDLALWQANFVKRLLGDLGHVCELKIIKTQGDIMSELDPLKMEGKGFFTKEIEDALLKEEADIAVHSFKDLPTESVSGLVIAAVSDREDPSELLLVNKKSVDPKLKFSLKIGARIGTSSARRKSQLLAYRTDLKVEDIRGNVPTRLRKLREGQFDAILIASAGVERLELDTRDLHAEKILPTDIIPAPAQGILAIQCRQKDADLISVLKKIDHSDTRIISHIERTVLNLFQGGCQTPVGVYASYDDEKELFTVRATRAEAWNTSPVSIYSESEDPGKLPERIIQKIKSISPVSVFVTRNGFKKSYLKNVLEGNGFTVEERALIEFTPIPFNNLPDYQWVFFSSKHAVKYFLSQKPQLDSARFGCIGRATSDELRKFGQRAEFVGQSTDTRMIGKQFSALAGSAKVLFPMAKGSLRSIQQQFVKPENVIDLVVYETQKKNTGEMPSADIIVFTSPSNVEAWFENYNFPADRKAVAMGDATANTLKRFKVHAAAMPDTFDDAGLARAIFGASGK